jgi:prepilin signal peptidase PulO-like enzyme (type II secretory pathway)
MTLFEIPLYENLPWQYTSLFVMLGAAIGSFFNVLALRWPMYQIVKNDLESKFWIELRGNSLKATSGSEVTEPSLMDGRSHCPSCSAAIPLYRNIPLISWLLLRGVSACCKKSISPRYLAYEAFGASIFLGIALTTGPSMSGLLLGIFLMTLSLMALIDLSEGFIPENLLFISFFTSYGLAMSPIGIGLEAAFIAHLLCFFGLYLPFAALSKLIGRQLVGTADFHLIALSASFLGATAWMIAPLIIPFAALTWGLIHSGMLKRGLFASIVGNTAIPAGPAIVLSTYVLVVMKLMGVL